MPPSERPAAAALAAHAPRNKVSVPITREIPLALLLEPRDPMRHNMSDEDMLELQRDIAASGLYQNLCVVPVLPIGSNDWQRVVMVDYEAHVLMAGHFRVAAGHRRLLACRAVNHNPVKCEIFADLTIDEDQIMAGENTHREDPSDFDLAVLYTKWLKEPGLTEAQLIRRAGKTPEFIYARVDILKGYQFVAEALHARKISFSVARAINRCDEPEFAQHFLNMAIDQGATTQLVNGWRKEREAYKAMTPAAAPGGAQPLHITAPAFQKIECCVCGDTQSYNLQTVMMCGADVERIRAIRAVAESAEENSPGSEAKSA